MQLLPKSNLELTFLFNERRIPKYSIAPTARHTIGLAEADLDLREYLGQLSLSYVSRVHLAIGCDENGWFVLDESTNGAYLNGRRLPKKQPHTIQTADRITLPADSGRLIEIELNIAGTERIRVNKRYLRNLCVPHAEELNNILENLDKQQGTHLVGPVGLGKSIILDELMTPLVQENLQTNARLFFCELDMHRVPDYEPLDFFVMMIHNLISSLRLLHGDYGLLLQDLSTIAEKVQKESNQSAFASHLLAALDKIGQITRRHVVFVIRHFDILVRHFDPSLIVDLKNLARNHAWSAIFVISSSNTLAYLSLHAIEPEPVWSFLDVVGPPRLMKRLSATELQDCLQDMVGTPGISPQLFNITYQLSNGWLSLAKAILYELAAAEQHLTNSSLVNGELDLNQLQQRLLATDNVISSCKQLWRDLPLDEQNTLSRIVAKTQANEDKATTARLIHKGIVIEGNQRYQVFCNLFAQYIANTGDVPQPDSLAQVGDIVIDRTKSIVRIEDTLLRLGDSLSKLEYKLLLYLADHANQVCSDDDILTEVYEDVNYDHGGNARVKRLISRLRQKIKEVSPQANQRQEDYIDNVRGAGTRLNVKNLDALWSML